MGVPKMCERCEVIRRRRVIRGAEKVVQKDGSGIVARELAETSMLMKQR